MNNLRKALLFKNDWDFIDIIHIQTGNYCIGIDITKVGNLRLYLLCQELRASTYNDIWKNPPLFKEIHTLLCRFRLLFVHTIWNRHIGKVNIDYVLPSYIFFHLPHRLYKEFVLDVTNSSPYFYNDKIWFFFCYNFKYVVFYYISHMGYILYGLPKVVPSPLLFPDHVEYLTHGQVPFGFTGHTQKPFIVPKIHIHLSPVIQHKDFSMLKGVHGARIHIKIAITLDGNNFES